MKTLRRNRRARKGFTLIEVLVALGMTSVVATGLYSLSLVASQTFQTQQRVSETQLRLRSAMETLRVDIQRAGYMASPNTVTDNFVCPKPTNALQAVQVENASPNPTHLPADNVFLNPQRLILTGNYVNTAEYRIAAVNGTTIYIQHRWDDWNRDMTTATEMERIFPAGRVVRLRGSDGRMQFGTVQSTSWRAATAPITQNPTITLSTAPLVINGTTAGCGLTGVAAGATIAPISMIEYTIRNASDTQSLAYTGSAPFTTGKTDLVRRELRISGGALTVVNGSETIVAEYAVDLDFAAVVDSALSTAAEPLLQRHAFGIAAVRTILAGPTAGTSQAQRLRTLAYRLSVRDRVQDPDYGWTPRTSAAIPLTRFRVFAGTQSGAARVRTATSEVAVINVASRNLR